jgi:tetratricopeptide (TPR) repeat protein
VNLINRFARGALLAVVLSPLVLLATAQLPSASAQEKDLELELAKQRFGKGQKLFDEGKFTEAVKEFKEAYKLKQLPLLLYNIAFTYDKLADKTLAEHYYEKFLTDAPAGTPNLEIAKARLPELKKEIEADEAKPDPVDPTLPKDPVDPVKVPPVDNTPPKVKVTEFQHIAVEEAPPGYPLDISMLVPDDKSIGATLYYRSSGQKDFVPVAFRQRYNEHIARIPREAMRGSTVQYYIEAIDQATGKQVWSTGRAGSPNVILVDEAAKPRYYNDVEDSGPKGGGKRPPAVGNGGHGEDFGDNHDDNRGHRTGKTRFRIWKWVAAGVGGAVLGVGIYYNRTAASRSSDIENLAGKMTTFAGNPRQYQVDGEYYETWGNVFMISGLVIGGGAAALFLLDKPVYEKAPVMDNDDDDEDARAPTTTRRIYAAPMVSPGLIGATGGFDF